MVMFSMSFYRVEEKRLIKKGTETRENQQDVKSQQQADIKKVFEACLKVFCFKWNVKVLFITH